MLLNKINELLVNGSTSYFQEEFAYEITTQLVVDKALQYNQRFHFSYTDGIHELTFTFQASSMIQDLLEVIGAVSVDGHYSSCNLEDLRAYIRLTYHRFSSSYRVHISKVEV